jgi:xanthine dehydrogenase YagS FAD-binding subunit
MNPFTYSAVDSVDAALNEFEAAAGREAGQPRFIAGGTNILDLMKENVERPTRLVDINQLPLEGIEPAADGTLRLGALARNAQTAHHPVVREQFPVLSSAILAGASAQIRNMASNGGNLLQRTRCYYFYDAGTPCNKRVPGSGCSAIGGLARQHAILGASEHCIATHPSDMCVALAALDATVHVVSKRGERAIAFADFHRLPEDLPDVDTALANDELILFIAVPPAQQFRTNSVYVKIRERQSYAFALISVAAMLALDDHGLISDARLALGGVAHKPWRSRQAEALLIGHPANETSFNRVADIILCDATPQGVGVGSNAFKTPLARRAIVRALAQAAQGTVTNFGDNIDE